MDAALLGGREGIWQPCAPSCSGRNGSAAPLPCRDIRRRQWVGASQPSSFRFPLPSRPRPSHPLLVPPPLLDNFLLRRELCAAGTPCAS